MKHTEWALSQVLVVGCQDGEGKDHTLAIAVVPKETAENYSYFINCLKNNSSDIRKFFESSELVVISDRSKGLIKAIAECLPMAHHRYCIIEYLTSKGRTTFENLYNQAQLYSMSKNRRRAVQIQQCPEMDHGRDCRRIGLLHLPNSRSTNPLASGYCFYARENSTYLQFYCEHENCERSS